MFFFLAKSVPTQFVLTHIQLIPWILRIDKNQAKRFNICVILNANNV